MPSEERESPAKTLMGGFEVREDRMLDEGQMICYKA